MAFSPSFTVSASAASPSTVVFTDDSSGSDVLILARRIYVTDYAGNPIVQSVNSNAYLDWPLATNPISFDLLTQNTAVNVLVQWLGAADAVLYEDDNDFCLREYAIQFFIYLIQNQALTPGIVQDANYFSNLALFYVNMQGAETMIVDAADLAASQNCLNRCTLMQNDQSFFF